MFKSKIEREYGDVILEIKNGNRRDPQHQPPASVEADGTTLLDQQHRDLWDAFARFGEIINIAQHHGPWSFEETPKVEFGWDGPDYGRHYRIYYNAMPAGSLQIGLARLLFPEYGRGASGDLNLDFPQLVPAGEVRDLLRTLWFMFAVVEDGAVMRSKADVEVTKIMSQHLWEVMRDPQSVQGLNWSFDGPYQHYEEHLG